MKSETPHRLEIAAACGLAAVLTAAVAQAQYVTGFENPPFTPGAIASQDSWISGGTVSSVRTASDISALLTASGLNADETVHSGTQALLMSGGEGSVTTRRFVTGLESETYVSLDAWVRPLDRRLDVGATNVGNSFLVLEDSSNSSAGRAAAVRFGYDTSALAHIDYATSVSGIWQSTGLSWDPDTWYNITMNLDMAAQTYDFYLDGAKVNSSPIPFYSGNTVTSIGGVRFYRGGAQAGMIIDDLTIVPEPASIALLLAGGCALLLRRKR